MTAAKQAKSQGDVGTPLVDTRPCTCHPDDNPPRPCPRKYALADCKLAALERRCAELKAALQEYGEHAYDCRAKKLCKKDEYGLWRLGDCTCGLSALLSGEGSK